MQYRKLGKSGIEVSALGFGCMRLPTVVEGYENKPRFGRPVNEEASIEMLQHAYANGINYFDTAYPYHGGMSEKILGKAVKSFRDKVLIATKLPVMLVQKPSDMEKFFEEQLAKLDTDYVDFYLLHGLNRRSWPLLKEFKVLDFLERLISQARIRFAGFSFHDNVDVFKEIVDSYDWTLCQIQYNYFDEQQQAGREGLRYAAGKGMGVAIMEPLRGGSLTNKIPPAVQAVWDSAQTKRTPAERAFRWVFNQQEVSLVLSGMSAMPQLIENLKTVEDARVGCLDADELALIQQAQSTYEELLKIKCTGCGYCMPCPNSVDIPRNFTAYNDYYLFGDIEGPRMFYNRRMSETAKASNCAECGECEEKCPQSIDIIDELKSVHSLLGNRG